jgi:hypothetical protein
MSEEADQIRYFRVSDEVYSQIERAAVATGEQPNNWYRNIALTAPVNRLRRKIATDQGRTFWKKYL